MTSAFTPEQEARIRAIVREEMAEAYAADYGLSGNFEGAKRARARFLEMIEDWDAIAEKSARPVPGEAH